MPGVDLTPQNFASGKGKDDDSGESMLYGRDGLEKYISVSV